MSIDEYCPHGAHWTTCPDKHPPPEDTDALTWENMIKMELRATDAESKLRIAEARIVEELEDEAIDYVDEMTRCHDQVAELRADIKELVDEIERLKDQIDGLRMQIN